MKGKKIYVVIGSILIASIGGVSLFHWINGRQIDRESEEYKEYLSEQDQGEEEKTEIEQETETQSSWLDFGEYVFTSEDTGDISQYIDPDIYHATAVSKNTVARASEFEFQYDEEMEVDDSLFSGSVQQIYLTDPTSYKVLLSVLAQYADAKGKEYGVFEMDGYYQSMWQEDELCGHKVNDTSTGETIYVACTDTGFDIAGYVYKVE